MRRTLFLLVTAGVLHAAPIESVCTLTSYSAETTTQTVRGAGCSIERDGAYVRDESRYMFGVDYVSVGADLGGVDNWYPVVDDPQGRYISVIGNASTVIEHSYVLRTTGPVRNGAMLFDGTLSQGYQRGGYVEIGIGDLNFTAEECWFDAECRYNFVLPWTLGVPFTVNVRAGASHNNSSEPKTEGWSAGAFGHIYFQPAELGRCPEGDLSQDCIALIDDGVYLVPEPGTASLLLAASVCFGLLGLSRRLHIEG